MKKSACNLMKLAAVSSVAFMVIGGVLVFLAQQLPLETSLPALFVALGFFSIITGVLGMIGTVIVVTLPNVSRQLDLCQH